MNLAPLSTQYLQKSKNLVNLYGPINSELKLLEEFIQTKLESKVELITQTSNYLFAAGGKRVRPVILLAIAKLLDANIDTAVKLAAVIEFIHNATLLHDDVIDKSDTRRGLQSINNLHGNSVSVLVGDFLYSRAFQIMSGLNNPQISQILSNATNTIAEGEVLQLSYIGQLELTRKQYLSTIFGKTAKLFECSSELGAVIAENYSSEIQKNAANFGLHLGYAFQLTDDALDYCADPKNSGKVIGKDLQEGKITMPMLIAIENSKNPEKLKAAIKNRNSDSVDFAMEEIVNCNGIEQTMELTQKEIDKAKSYLNEIPSSSNPQVKDLLFNICEFVGDRIF